MNVIIPLPEDSTTEYDTLGNLISKDPPPIGINESIHYKKLTEFLIAQYPLDNDDIHISIGMPNYAKFYVCPVEKLYNVSDGLYVDTKFTNRIKSGLLVYDTLDEVLTMKIRKVATKDLSKPMHFQGYKQIRFVKK